MAQKPLDLQQSQQQSRRSMATTSDWTDDLVGGSSRTVHGMDNPVGVNPCQVESFPEVAGGDSTATSADILFAHMCMAMKSLGSLTGDNNLKMIASNNSWEGITEVAPLLGEFMQKYNHLFTGKSFQELATTSEFFAY